MMMILALYGLPTLMIGYLILDYIAEKIVYLRHRKELKALGIVRR